jgi:phage I-like protein
MGEAKRRREHEKLVALAAYAAAAFDVGEDGKRVAPSEFRLFHAGLNHTSKGDFTFDDIAAQLVMEAFQARNHSVPLMGDYEHMSLATPPIKALASCTQFVPAIKRDANGGPELWATEVQWTDEARKELEAGQYRMYSPAFVPSEDGRIAALINFALTNLPASYDIAPLVAASEGAPSKDNDMEEELKALKEQLAQAQKDSEALKGTCESMKALCLKKLGKSFDDWSKEESAENEDAKELTALRSQVIAITGKASVSEAIGAINLMATQAAELVTLKTKIEADKTTAEEAEFTALCESSVKEGKLPPAMKASFVALKTELGTTKALSALKAFVPTEPIVSLRGEIHEPIAASAVDPMQVTIARNCAGQFGGEAAFKNYATAAK